MVDKQTERAFFSMPLVACDTTIFLIFLFPLGSPINTPLRNRKQMRNIYLKFFIKGRENIASYRQKKWRSNGNAWG